MNDLPRRIGGGLLLVGSAAYFALLASASPLAPETLDAWGSTVLCGAWVAACAGASGLRFSLAPISFVVDVASSREIGDPARVIAGDATLAMDARAGLRHPL